MEWVYKDNTRQLDLFHTAQAQFESGRFQEAKEVFESITVADPLIDKYLARIKSESPDERWSPGWRLTEK